MDLLQGHIAAQQVGDQMHDVLHRHGEERGDEDVPDHHLARQFEDDRQSEQDERHGAELTQLSESLGHGELGAGFDVLGTQRFRGPQEVTVHEVTSTAPVQFQLLDTERHRLE